MKREGSRFTHEELNLVITNWEKIASDFQGAFNLYETRTDDRALFYRVINRNNIDHIETVLYKLEINIPYLGKTIRIISCEYKPPIFEFEIQKSNFSFSITNEDILDKINKKVFRLKEIETGYADFDKKHLLFSSNREKLCSILDPGVREWLGKIKIAYLDFNTSKAKNLLRIYFTFNEFKIDVIKEQIEMFKYCIDRINQN
jgi:hypothetical protein